MRNSRWLRYGLASLTIFGAGLSAFLVACGDDDAPSGGTSTSSSSSSSGNTSSSSSSSSSGGGDDGGGTDGGAVEPAKLQLVNAATDFGPQVTNLSGGLRICYKITGGGRTFWAPLPPLPNRSRGPGVPPGVYIGTGGAVDGTGSDLSGVEIEPFILSAGKLESLGLGSTITAGNDKYCDEIFDLDAGGQLMNGVDYWVLPKIPAGALQQKMSYLLLLTGCAGSSTLGAEKCGADFTAATPNGNLKITRFELDRQTAIPAAEFGVQFIHASPNADAVVSSLSGGTLKVRPAVMSNGADPTTAKLAAGDGGTNSDVQFLGVTQLRTLTGVNTDTDSFSAQPNIAALAVSFPRIQALSFGAADAGVYANGKAITFIAVGDPTADPDGGPAAPGGFNLRSFHYLGLPNDPAVKKFDDKL